MANFRNQNILYPVYDQKVEKLHVTLSSFIHDFWSNSKLPQCLRLWYQFIYFNIYVCMFECIYLRFFVLKLPDLSFCLLIKGQQGISHQPAAVMTNVYTNISYGHKSISIAAKVGHCCYHLPLLPARFVSSVFVFVLSRTFKRWLFG